MNALRDARCLNHPEREAAARCPACRQYFCRECVTEHQYRVVCTRCLARLTSRSALRRRRLAAVGALLQTVVGFFLLWALLIGLGRRLAP